MYRHNTWAAGYRRLYYRVLTHVLQILDRGSGTVLASPCTRQATISTMLRCMSRMKQVKFLNLRNAPYCPAVLMLAQTAGNVGLTLSLT